MARRFGPTRGAGVVVIEESGNKPITPGALGMCGYAGLFERGNPGELILCLDPVTFKRKLGGRYTGTLAPDACQDYYKIAAGAGGLLIVRVTDGNELPAEMPVYTRQLPRTQLGTLSAKNGGRWGGKQAYYTNVVADVDTDVTAITLDTGVSSWTTDQWKGATLRLAGVTNKTYTVVGNDDTGVLTVEADQDMDEDLEDGGDPTNARYYLSLENEGAALSILFTDGDENPDSEFGMVIYDNGEKVKTYANLSTNPDSGRYWVDIINTDTGNDWVTAEDLFDGSHVASVRPANHYGRFTSITATILTAVIHDFLIDSVNAGNPTIALGTTTDDMKPQTITITMTGATTFTAVSDLFGSLGAAGTFGVLYTPNNEWTPPFTITAGELPVAAADVLTLIYKPFKADELIDGFLFADKADDRRLKYRIIDNNRNTITVAAGSTMNTDITVSAGTAASGASITFVPVADLINGQTFVLVDALGTEVTFHFDVSGAYTPVGGYNALNVRVDVSADVTDAQVAARARTAINAAAVRITAAAPVGALVGLVQLDVGEAGNTDITETVADTDFVVVNFSGGVDPSTNEFMVEQPLEMAGGRDGHADIADSHYIAQAWDINASPFNRVVGKNLGLIKFATPGVTATGVQQAGRAYADTMNHQYRYEVPSNIVTEQAVDEYINDTLGRNDYAVVSFPGQVWVADPDSTDGKLKLVSATGMIHGREARIAADYDGYHKAEAGIDATLPGIVKLPTEDAILNEEYLNPLGINVIKKARGNFILWGDRTLWVDPEWKWKHQREQMSYYEHVLMENFDFIVFAINDSQTQDMALTSLRSFFLPEYTKRALRGETFQKAAIIKVDNEINTDATRAAGDMFAEIKLQLADTVERFIMRIGKQGLFESVAA